MPITSKTNNKNRSATIDRLISDDCLPIAISDDLSTISAYFQNQTEFAALPVVHQTHLLGCIYSADVLKACMGSDHQNITARQLMKLDCPVVESGTSLEHVCSAIGNKKLNFESGYLCVIDAQAIFKGMVPVHSLLQEITRLRLNFTRYNNPLSSLPGSVHVTETVDRLIATNKLFVVVHCDINDFKVFNDTYGYERGDEVILFVAAVLQESIDPDVDFVAHTSGDDFTIIFQSPDWFERCERMERKCAVKATQFYSQKHRFNQGINSFDRMGRRVFTPFFTLALGAVQVEPGKFSSHHEVIVAALEVKQRAKSTFGGAIYIDERNHASQQTRSMAKN